MAINRSDLSEVTFYSCTTRSDYEKENSKDSGGLYVFRDGTGIYRGKDAVSGPAPIQIVAKSDDTFSEDVISGSFVKYTCGYDCELSFTRLRRYLIGPGNRPIRFIDKDSNVIELYAVSYDSNNSQYILCNTYSGISYRLSEDSSDVLEVSSVTYRVELNPDRLVVEVSSNSTPTMRLINELLGDLSDNLSKLSKSHEQDSDEVTRDIESLNSLIKTLSDVLLGYDDDDTGDHIDGVVSKLSSVNQWISRFESTYQRDQENLSNDLSGINETLSDHDDKLSDLADFDDSINKILHGDEGRLGILAELSALKQGSFWDIRLPEDEPESEQ